MTEFCPAKGYPHNIFLWSCWLHRWSLWQAPMPRMFLLPCGTLHKVCRMWAASFPLVFAGKLLSLGLDGLVVRGSVLSKNRPVLLAWVYQSTTDDGEEVAASGAGVDAWLGGCSSERILIPGWGGRFSVISPRRLFSNSIKNPGKKFNLVVNILVLQCFTRGFEYKKHQSDHTYEIMVNVHFSSIPLRGFPLSTSGLCNLVSISLDIPICFLFIYNFDWQTSLLVICHPQLWFLPCWDF